MTIACGQCIGCRLSRSQDWATRIHHEAQLHSETAFITLTYADEHLPDNYSVSVRPLQLLMKRLRKKLGHKVRFFACGEYGEQTLRPHYHILLFGYSFPDKTAWRKSPTGHVLYRSEYLEKLWPYGLSEIGSVTQASAGYVARYVLKKVTGNRAEDHYTRLHPITGQISTVKPEFICMSNRPGIGGEWYNQFSGDAFPSDFLTIDGSRVPVPRYYKKKLSEEAQQAVNANRKKKALKHAANNTPARLSTRLELQHLRAARLIRQMDEN